MNEKDRQVLLKICKHIDAVLQYCAAYTDAEHFQSDTMCVEACVFNLMQIGELSKQALSDELKSEIRTIPWKQLYGMRNRIVHGYDGVEMQIVWDTISEDLPILRNELGNYLAHAGN